MLSQVKGKTQNLRILATKKKAAAGRRPVKSLQIAAGLWQVEKLANLASI
jgi:hypothetical protein